MEGKTAQRIAASENGISFSAEIDIDVKTPAQF